MSCEVSNSYIKCSGLPITKFSLKIPPPLARPGDPSFTTEYAHKPCAPDSQGTYDSDLTADKEKESGNQAILLLPSQTLEADQRFLAPFRHICFIIYAWRTVVGDSEFLLASSMITVLLAGIKQTGGSPYLPPHHGSSTLHHKHLNANILQKLLAKSLE